MLVTHLQGPHQSVCWLRPKRARHFLGEPGSEHRHAQHEQGEGRRGGGQTPEERVSGGGARGGCRVSRSDLLVAARRNISSKKAQRSRARAFGAPRTSWCACVGGGWTENCRFQLQKSDRLSTLFMNSGYGKRGGRLDARATSCRRRRNLRCYAGAGIHVRAEGSLPAPESCSFSRFLFFLFPCGGGGKENTITCFSIPLSLPRLHLYCPVGTT